MPHLQPQLSQHSLNHHRRAESSRQLVRCTVAALLMTLTLVCGCVAPRPVPPRPHDIHPVISVTPFENRSRYPGEWQLGEGMADLLTNELAASDHFTVVERQHLDTVVGEIQRQEVDLFRREGRVDPGKLKNARYQIRGVVTDFEHLRGGRFDYAWRWLIHGGRPYTARVSLKLSVVDIETGEIVRSLRGLGEAKARRSFGESRYSKLPFGGDAYLRTPVGQATSSALRDCLLQLIEIIPRQKWRPLIAAVSQDQVIINGGHDQGLRRGEIFRVHEAAVPVTDPITGDHLNFLPGERIGLIQITSVDDHTAIAKTLEGARFRRGQSLVEEPPVAPTPPRSVAPAENPARTSRPVEPNRP